MTTSAGVWNRDLLAENPKPEKIFNEQKTQHGCLCRLERAANDLQTVKPCYNFTSSNSMGYEDVNTTNSIEQNVTSKKQIQPKRKKRKNIAILFTVQCRSFSVTSRVDKGRSEGKSHNKKQ